MNENVTMDAAACVSLMKCEERWRADLCQGLIKDKQEAFHKKADALPLRQPIINLPLDIEAFYFKLH